MEELMAAWNTIFSVRNIVIYLVIISVITFLAMWLDKRKAQYGKWRTKEMTLLILALLGGSIGGIIGMYTFHHKTKKLRFYLGFPVILICQILLIVMQYI